MSPGPGGVFQLTKKITLRGILAFCNLCKIGPFGGASVGGPGRLRLAGGTGPKSSEKCVPRQAHKQTRPILDQSVWAPD